MRVDEAKRGMRVMITDADPAWAYVHGWTGYIDALNNGKVQVSAMNLEGRPVVLFVPPEMLRAIG